jgi:hypothetical protein
MKVIEAIQANPVFADTPVEAIQYALDSRSIDGLAVYDVSSLKNVELVSADLYMDMALLPEFREGQLAMKYNADAIKGRALAIYLKYGDDRAADLQPKPINVAVTDVSDVA